MRIVNNYGELIRMSERNYKRFLQDGKMIGVIDFTCTDATKAIELAASLGYTEVV